MLSRKKRTFWIVFDPDLAAVDRFCPCVSKAEAKKERDYRLKNGLRGSLRPPTVEGPFLVLRTATATIPEKT